MDQHLLQLANHVAYRLERLSVDSFWAHRASGVRRSIVRLLEVQAPSQDDDTRLAQLVEQGFRIIEHAAREIGDRH